MNARPLNIFRVGGLSAAAEAGKYLALYAFHLGKIFSCLCLFTPPQDFEHQKWLQWKKNWETSKSCFVIQNGSFSLSYSMIFLLAASTYTNCDVLSHVDNSQARISNATNNALSLSKNPESEFKGTSIMLFQ